MGFPGDSVVKNQPANAGDTGDMGSIPGLGRSARGENGNCLWYSSLGNPIDRGACWATVHRVTKSQTQLNNHACADRNYILLYHFPKYISTNTSFTQN